MSLTAMRTGSRFRAANGSTFLPAFARARTRTDLADCTRASSFGFASAKSRHPRERAAQTEREGELMATLRQVGEVMTTELRERVERLVSAVDDDALDFSEIARLADAVGELADMLGETYSDLEQTLMGALRGDSGSKQEEDDSQQEQEQGDGQPRGAQRQEQSDENGPTAEDVTKEELLERAREAGIEGRSSMTKEDLAQAVEAEESVTKEELLERAREVNVSGRSSMTKDELAQAVQAEESLTKEELLERARDAGIEGRSAMKIGRASCRER